MLVVGTVDDGLLLARRAAVAVGCEPRWVRRSVDLVQQLHQGRQRLIVDSDVALRARRIEQRRREVSAALLDFCGIHCGATVCADVESDLKCADPVECGAVRRRIEHQCVKRRDRVPTRDRARHHLIQCAAGVDAEPRRMPFGDPAHVHPRHAVGLLLTDQNRRFLIADKARARLQCMAVFMGEQSVDLHVAEELLGDGHQVDAVPRDQVVGCAVQRVVVERARLLAAYDFRASRIHRHEPGYRGELTGERVRVVLRPEVFDVLDRQQGLAVDLTVVGVFHPAGGCRRCRRGPLGPSEVGRPRPGTGRSASTRHARRRRWPGSAGNGDATHAAAMPIPDKRDHIATVPVTIVSCPSGSASGRRDVRHR